MCDTIARKPAAPADAQGNFTVVISPLVSTSVVGARLEVLVRVVVAVACAKRK